MGQFLVESMDRDGILVRLSSDVWEKKILTETPLGHPEVKPYLSSVEEAIVKPDVIFRSNWRKNVKLFYKLAVNEKGHHLVVVVKYVKEIKEVFGYVSTFYLTRKMYSKGEILWKKTETRKI